MAPRGDEGEPPAGQKPGEVRPDHRGRPCAVLRLLRNPSLAPLLEHIRDTPGISRLELADLLGVAGPSVTRQVQRLIDEELVESRRCGRFQRYWLTQECAGVFATIEAARSVHDPVMQPGDRTSARGIGPRRWKREERESLPAPAALALALPGETLAIGGRVRLVETAAVTELGAVLGPVTGLVGQAGAAAGAAGGVPLGGSRVPGPCGGAGGEVLMSHRGRLRAEPVLETGGQGRARDQHERDQRDGREECVSSFHCWFILSSELEGVPPGDRDHVDRSIQTISDSRSYLTILSTARGEVEVDAARQGLAQARARRAAPGECPRTG